MQAQADEAAAKYEEKLQTQKVECATQIKEITEKYAQDKDACEARYEQKRKALKELEANFAKQTAKSEKEKAVIQEKYANLEAQKAELEKQHLADAAVSQGQIAQLKEALNKDKTGVIQENEKYRKRQLELEKEIGELQANYERDRELWNGKFKFLEQQRDQSRSDLAEGQKKFESTLEQLQKRGSMDKDKQETNQTALIISMEERYKSQIKDMNESHQQLYSELLLKNKQLEKDLKQLSEKTQLDQRGKMSEQGSLEKKLTSLAETQDKLKSELEEVKTERDKKIAEYQKLLEKEKEGYKAKVQEAESKCKEIESKRSSLIFEFEKERTKWAIEKDHLLTQKNEAQLVIESLEKKKETLMLDNEKLKSQRAVRKPLYAGTGNTPVTSYGAPSRYTSYAAGKYKENLAKYSISDEKQDIVETGSNNSSNTKPTGKGIAKMEEEPSK